MYNSKTVGEHLSYRGNCAAEPRFVKARRCYKSFWSLTFTICRTVRIRADPVVGEKIVPKVSNGFRVNLVCGMMIRQSLSVSFLCTRSRILSIHHSNPLIATVRMHLCTKNEIPGTMSDLLSSPRSFFGATNGATSSVFDIINLPRRILIFQHSNRVLDISSKEQIVVSCVPTGCHFLSGKLTSTQSAILKTLRSKSNQFLFLLHSGLWFCVQQPKVIVVSVQWRHGCRLLCWIQIGTNDENKTSVKGEKCDVFQCIACCC